MIRTHLAKSLYENLLGPQHGPTETIEQPYVKYQMGILESCYHSDLEKDIIPASDEKNPGEKGKSADILADPVRIAARRRRPLPVGRWSRR